MLSRPFGVLSRHRCPRSRPTPSLSCAAAEAATSTLAKSAPARLAAMAAITVILGIAIPFAIDGECLHGRNAVDHGYASCAYGAGDGAVVSYAAGGSVGLSSGLETDMVTFL